MSIMMLCVQLFYEFTILLLFTVPDICRCVGLVVLPYDRLGAGYDNK